MRFLPICLGCGFCLCLLRFICIGMHAKYRDIFSLVIQGEYFVYPLAFSERAPVSASLLSISSFAALTYTEFASA